MSVDTPLKSQPPGRRLAAELAFLAAVGLLVGVLGPFGSDAIPGLRKHLYWMTVMVGGGLIGIALDEVVGRWFSSAWRRVAVVSLLMTPAVSLYVLGVVYLFFGQTTGLPGYAALLWQVFAISLPVMTVRALVWRPPRLRLETRVIVEPPLPEAEATFRRRLTARRRTSPLIAVEAHDHYLRVHTEAGVELITLRFADALAELSQAHGYQTHRSWWVAAQAIEAVRWRRGVGEARLARGVIAPVSRTFAPLLKAAGWS